MKLTIAIPTFNRNEVLNQTLQRILPQLTPECFLLIADNCSDIPVTETVRGVLSDVPESQYKIVCNTVNIGASANVVRLFERANTEWIWILSDDDHLHSDAVATIFEVLAAETQDENLVWINFAIKGLERNAAFSSRGQSEFVEKFDHFNNIIFLSASLYRVHKISPHIRYGYIHAFSLLPHIAILLQAIGDKGVCLFSQHKIVEYVNCHDDDHWPFISYYIGMPTLLDAPLDGRIRNRLATKLDVVRPSFARLFPALLSEAVERRDRRSAQYFFNRISHAGEFGTRRHFFSQLERWAFSVAVRFPYVSMQMVKLVYRLLRGRKYQPNLGTFDRV